MRRLRGGVHDRLQVTAMFLEKFIHGCDVADINVVMLVTRNALNKMIASSSGGGFIAEEGAAHVVINADY